VLGSVCDGYLALFGIGVVLSYDQHVAIGTRGAERQRHIYIYIVCRCVDICIYIFVCIYVYMYIHIHIYT